MNRSDKATAIAVLNECWKPVTNAVLVDFTGLTVLQFNTLRRSIATVSSSCRVVKNRVALRAIEGTALAGLEPYFQGPTAAAYNDNDPVALAKALLDFAKDNPSLKVKAGVIDGEGVLEPAALAVLAKLPALPELRAQLLRVVQAPATRLVRLLAAPATQLAQVIKARADKLSESEQE